MSRIAPTITLTDGQQAELQSLLRARSASQADALRARIVLLAAQGWPNEEIAAELNTALNTVCKWRRRFAAEGLAGLGDRPRSGRPLSLAAQTCSRVLTEVTCPPQGGAIRHLHHQAVSQSSSQWPLSRASSKASK